MNGLTLVNSRFGIVGTELEDILGTLLRWKCVVSA